MDDGKVHEPIYAKCPEALFHDLDVTDGAVRLYCHMIWRYGRNRDNHEGQKKMADHLGVSEATIAKRIKELEAKDWIITVEREFDEATGKYQTPFYHVFISQEECRNFRANYQPVDGERIGMKPADVRQRKSRKGVGGNPKLKQGADENRPNSSSDGHRPNSSSDVPPNSSSDDLDAVDLSLKKDEPQPRKHFHMLWLSGKTYKDGKHVSPDQFPLDVNKLFYAWYDALVAVGREPAATMEYLWEVERESATTLALARVTPEQVTDFVNESYTGKNPFWRNADYHMRMEKIVNGITGYLRRKSKTGQTAGAMVEADRQREEMNKAKAAELARARGENVA